MCRLAIRDPSESGRQPFRHGGIEVIFNGEIYNTPELRARLADRGHQLTTSCDTEVVLKAYVEFGVGAFDLLDGMFAVAVVDQERDELILARDEFGVKPLFVAAAAQRIAFASEPKGLRALGALDGGIDVDELERYLRYQYVPEPGSPWRGVRRVARGTYEAYSLTTLTRTRSGSFQQPGLPLPDRSSAPEVWVEATAAALSTSVERQLVSDRPLGIFLSGGIDSTLVAGCATALRPGIRAFGISVPEWERDERQYMDEASRHLDLDLTITAFAEHDFDRLVDQVLDTYDEPFGDFSALPTMLVSEAAASELRVVLSGDGADELFGGYARYAHAPWAQRLGRVPAPVLAAASAVLSPASSTLRDIVDRVQGETRAKGHGYGALLALASQHEAAALLGRPAPSPSTLSPRNGHRRGWSNRAAFETAMAVDVEQYLPADILTKLDRATMSVSLEARVPYLGGPVARLAAAMPTSIKLRGAVGKWPLKQLLIERGFDASFVHRPKMGFSLPMDTWLRDAMTRRPLYQDLLRGAPEPLDRAQCSRMLDSFLAGNASAHAVWSVLVLSGWLTRNA
jgi:asparagine synthase (glutamine-hydrolysing)